MTVKRRLADEQGNRKSDSSGYAYSQKIAEANFFRRLNPINTPIEEKVKIPSGLPIKSEAKTIPVITLNCENRIPALTKPKKNNPKWVRC